MALGLFACDLLQRRRSPDRKSFGHDQPDAAAAWFTQARTQASALVNAAPQWPRGQLGLGYVLAAAGDTAQAERAFTAARGCDASLTAAIARLTSELNAWRR